MAQHADAVIAIAMFADPLRGWADLVLPATSYLERDGTIINLEGRIQRLRRTVMPPCPDELAWIAKLAERFEVELSPYPSLVFDEVSATCFDGISYEELGERAPLPARGVQQQVEPREPAKRGTAGGGPLQVLRYRPLFSGPAVERVSELQFQRPLPEIELSAEDARTTRRRERRRGRRPVERHLEDAPRPAQPALAAGIVRIADEHAADLREGVEVSKGQ